jgi:3-oxoacyl-[acyl-carrier-protein] synthase II
MDKIKRHNPEKPRFRILIAGFGLITPLGGSAWQTFSALLKGRTLTERAGQLPADICVTDRVRATGAVISAQHSATDPAVDLTERAAREAAMMAGIQTTGLDCYVGASKGAVHALTAAFESRLPKANRSALNPAPPTDADLAVALGPHGYLNHHLRQRLHLGTVRHHVAACASSLTALHHARQSLLHGTPPTPSAQAPAEAASAAVAPPHTDPTPSSDTRYSTPDTQPNDYILVATAEASLLPLFIHSYRRLGVLAPQTPDGYSENPMDQSRQGFILSECGAAVLLKRVPIDAEPMPGETELLDTATAAEAYDIIRPSPTMPALRRVADQLFANRTIDVIHPHAPGTPDHDPAELNVYAQAIKHTGQSTLPDLYACKGAIGHGLGAAGLTSLVLACLCAKSRQRPPMPWLKNPIESPLPLTAQASPLKPSSTHAIFAAGFAGHTAGAVIQHH